VKLRGGTSGGLLGLGVTKQQHLAAEYGAQIADALGAAYEECNVIHRDIKPENLMLDRWGKIKVMDFGLARAPGHQQITIAKTLVGSIYYASPEQVWGQPLDNRSDIYALGVVLYEMVSGHRPFTGRTLPELTQAIVAGPLRPPSTLNAELAPEFEPIILKAMARNRDERYEHAAFMAQELRALNLRSFTTTASHNPTSPSPTRQQGPREGIVIRPPKRPRVKSKRYLELEATQPLPDESTQHSSRQPHTEPVYEQPTSPDRTGEYEDKVPTRPLGPITSMATNSRRSEQATTNPAIRRTFWRKVQRLFKSTS